MKKFIVMSWLAICAAAMFVSCEQADEDPPVENMVALRYKLPDPEPLTDADRALIDEMQEEYNKNAN